jgi:anthranilate phosphoribosyltransferase
MAFNAQIRRLVKREALDEETSLRLWSAMLDGAVDELEVGAVIAALAVRGETPEELLGLHRALRSRIAPWSPPLAERTICIPAYGLVPGEAAWVALAAGLLRKFGLTVIVHGVLDSPCGVSSASVLRELGLMPSASLAQADESLASLNAAFLPVQLLSPAFAALIALRARLGAENSTHLAALALDPTAGRATRLTFCVEGTASERYAGLAPLVEGDSVALSWLDARTPDNFAVRPRIDRLHAGGVERLFEADPQDTRTTLAQPPEDAVGIAHWVHRVVHGEVPVPVPALNLAAACLYAVGHAADFSQAKAIAAINAGRLAA